MRKNQQFSDSSLPPPLPSDDPSRPSWCAPEIFRTARQNAKKIVAYHTRDMIPRSRDPAIQAHREKRLLHWIRMTGLRPSKRWRCPTGLHNKRCDGGPHCHRHPLPHMDHVTCWSWGGRFRALVTQPYVDCRLDEEGRAELTAACDRLGLAWKEYANASWWNPPSTTLIVIFAREFTAAELEYEREKRERIEYELTHEWDEDDERALQQRLEEREAHAAEERAKPGYVDPLNDFNIDFGDAKKEDTE